MGEWNSGTPFSGYPIEVRTSGVEGHRGTTQHIIPLIYS